MAFRRSIGVLYLVAVGLSGLVMGCGRPAGTREWEPDLSNRVLLVDEPMPGGRLKVYSGEPGTLLRNKCVRLGSPLARIEDSWGRKLWQAEGSEITGNVILDYERACRGRIRWTQCVYDAREPGGGDGGITPFVATWITMRWGRVAEGDEELVLKPEPFDQAKVSEAVKLAMQGISSGELEDLEMSLAQLRSIGIGCPEKIMPLLDKLMEAARGRSGDCEVLTMYKAEIEWGAELARTKAPENATGAVGETLPPGQ